MITTRGTNFIRTPGGDQFHEIITIRALRALLINFIRIRISMMFSTQFFWWEKNVKKERLVPSISHKI